MHNNCNLLRFLIFLSLWALLQKNVNEMRTAASKTTRNKNKNKQSLISDWVYFTKNLSLYFSRFSVCDEIETEIIHGKYEN